jgi:uncharacterized membrane protein HdeD (DUF308 family)
MLALLMRNWWVLALRGQLAVLFGLAAFVWPATTLTALVLLFGAYAMVDGLFAVVTAVTERTAYKQWWLWLLQGLAGIAVGVLTFVWPGITALACLYLVAARAIVIGLLEILLALRLRKEMEREWLLVLGGMASLLYGLALAIWPGAGALALLWLIAAFAVAFGVLLTIFAFRLRKWLCAVRWSR